jgi:oxygen-independent coproporphyrinogen-3 oxidase
MIRNMAGIYIHIPFCKQRCTYCDFYTSVAPELTGFFVYALKKEIVQRSNYIRRDVKTIYFGGGTPSILKKQQLDIIFETIFNTFKIDAEAEITLEANPDDLSENFLNELKHTPVNRLSIGIQSFTDSDLQLMNRRHTAGEAIEAVKRAQNYGFKNISIDLIYGLPGQTLKQWNKQLEVAFSLNVQHISAYGLTYEEGTPLYVMKKRGEIIPCNDDLMNKMYSSMLFKMRKNGYETYEISNFALPGFRSLHNSAYWHQEHYLGLGPSAHSYNGVSRQWNIASTNKWIKALNENLPFFETEVLTETDKFNDYVMVSLRTAEGVDINYLKQNFNPKFVSSFLKNIQSFIFSGHVNVYQSNYYLNDNGFIISDFIIGKLIVV